jgi:hypothetical protein
MGGLQALVALDQHARDTGNIIVNNLSRRSLAKEEVKQCMVSLDEPISPEVGKALARI